MAGKMSVQELSRAIAGSVNRYQGSYLEVGILGDDANRPKELRDGATSTHATLGEVAHMLHYGTTNIPARPFLEIPIERRRAQVVQVLTRATAAVADQRMTELRALALIGEYVVGVIKDEIANRIPPPNAPSTIRKKGSDVPLIDVGQLRQSVSYQVRKIGA